MILLLHTIMYSLIPRSDERSLRFIDTYYHGLGRKAPKMNHSLNEIMFLPSLVGNVTQRD
jgi:hypothetical protein